MGKGDVKLLGAWPSPFVMRARIALQLKSIDYEFIEETMAPKSDLLLKSNPVYKKIPVLLHHDRAVCESLIILHYIDEAWPSSPSLFPSDPYDRATARFWASYIDDKWFPNMSGLSKAPEPEAKAAALAEAQEGLALLEDAFSKISQGKPFFGGDHIGYLDIAFGCFLGWLRVIERNSNVKLLDEAKTAGLVGWAERFCADPAVKGVMPDTDKLMEFAKILVARYKAASAGGN